MAINLLDVTPHQVSRDLRGYSVMFYGEPKSGKTTIASKFPNHLILAFEKGYSAIPGAMAQPINSWGEFKQTLRELKKPEVQERFETIIIDTADIAYDYVERFVCAQEGVDTINKIPFGGGYAKAGKEFDEALRSIVQMDYGLVIISHAADKVFTDESGVEYNQIVPTLASRPRLICQRLCDIIGYSRGFMHDDGTTSTKLYMRGTPRYVAGSRFKYTPDSIDFTYQNLVKSLNEAIDKQMEEDGKDLFTADRDKSNQNTAELDFDALMDEFQETVGDMMAKDATYYGPRITEIIEKYLGKGKKVSEASRDQAEHIDLILYDLREIG